MTEQEAKDLQIGQRVSYTGLRVDEDEDLCTEYGIVVAKWWDAKMGAYDTYVTFLGNSWPTEDEQAKPYILRYCARSLTLEKSDERREAPTCSVCGRVALLRNAVSKACLKCSPINVPHEPEDAF